MPLALIPARGLFGFRHTSGAVASLASASTLGRRLIWLPSHVWAVTVLAYVTSLGRTFDGFPFLSWTVTLLAPVQAVDPSSSWLPSSTWGPVPILASAISLGPVTLGSRKALGRTFAGYPLTLWAQSPPG